MAANCWEGRGNEYHLHSSGSTFCGGDEDEGLIPVSDEADDMEASAWDTVEAKRLHETQELSCKDAQSLAS